MILRMKLYAKTSRPTFFGLLVCGLSQMSIHLPSFSDMFVQILLLMLPFFIVDNAIKNVVNAFE